MEPRLLDLHTTFGESMKKPKAKGPQADKWDRIARKLLPWEIDAFTEAKVLEVAAALRRVAKRATVRGFNAGYAQGKTDGYNERCGEY